MQEGGFLTDVGGFDASFFGISPREAKMMDPQQRIFLEVACEALDDAGVPVHGLRGSSTGVFVGIYLNDYAERFTMTTPELIEPYYMTGNTLSGAACRLAYTLGLEGPAMAIDAACASSLVTVHLAARALQAGECDLAIAGGVNLILAPKVSVAACQGHILAPDGRCKAFDQAANGYARSEGCGVVVLKRITDARADHDRVRAVIAGSAVRHGGRTAGFTVPGSHSQHRLLNAALADASVAAGAVDYVEAHGTGTPLGDPVEMRALNAVYGAADSGTACLVGAVKTNLGHLETAAGVAGLIKTVMCLDHAQAPPNLHFRELNPAITFGESRICLAKSLTDLPHRDGGRHAAVSSFGLTGTIAHVVLREGGPPANGAGPAGGHAWLLPLSAKTPEALRAMGGATVALAADNELAGLCSTAALRRSHYEHRGAVVGGSQASLRAGLAALAEGRSDPALRVGRRRDPLDHGVVFVFSGQGSQWPGMGAELRGRPYEAFEETLAQCDRLIRGHTGWSVLDRLHSPGPGADVTQPLIFAVQVALAALWRSWGIRPDGVIGHSMGEVAAAYVAGALNLADAVHVICLRSRLVRALAGGGGMAVVELPYDEVLGFLGEYGNEVTVAAVNGPSSTVISGLREPLAAAADALGADGVTVRTVDVDYASHCGLVESVLPELKAGLASIRACVPDIPMYSTVTGTLVANEPLDAAYWQGHRDPPVDATRPRPATDRALGPERALHHRPRAALAGARRSRPPRAAASLPLAAHRLHAAGRAGRPGAAKRARRTAAPGPPPVHGLARSPGRLPSRRRVRASRGRATAPAILGARRTRGPGRRGAGGEWLAGDHQPHGRTSRDDDVGPADRTADHHVAPPGREYRDQGRFAGRGHVDELRDGIGGQCRSRGPQQRCGGAAGSDRSSLPAGLDPGRGVLRARRAGRRGLRRPPEGAG